MAEQNWMKTFVAETALGAEDAGYIVDGQVGPQQAVPMGAAVVPLPEPDFLPDYQTNFLEMIETRYTERQYDAAPLSKKELSLLLWSAQGVKMVAPNGTTMRNVPSAGACHALETYLLVNRVEDVQPGVYRFLALEHALLPIKLGAETVEELLPLMKSTRVVASSAVTLLWAADARRMVPRFGKRSARYLCFDAGHACENVYLAGTAARLGVCALGGFVDDALNDAFGFDGENEFFLYGAAVGKPMR